MRLKVIQATVSHVLSIVRHKNTKFIFSSPKKSKVLVIDAVDVDRLNLALLRGIEFEVLDARYGHEGLDFRVYISPKIICLVLYLLLKGQALWVSYCYAVIRCISPKVVIDNIHLPFVLPIAQKLPNISFYVISNGFWNDVLDKDIVKSFYTYSLMELFQKCPQKIFNFHIFCFGKKDSDIFRQCGLGEDITGITYHDIGSLFGDFTRYSLMNGEVSTNDYDIVFVSQCEHSSICGSDDFHKLLVENTRLAIKNLNTYIVEKNKRCLILLRGKPDYDAIEMEFYRSLFDEFAHVDFYRNDGAFAVYEGLARAPVIVSLFSTTGFEAMSWGKKVLFCLYGFTKIYKLSSDKYVADSDMLKWAIDKTDYAVFRKYMDELCNISTSDYVDETRNVRKYIISENCVNHADAYIRHMIFSSLEKTETTLGLH